MSDPTAAPTPPPEPQHSDRDPEAADPTAAATPVSAATPAAPTLGAATGLTDGEWHRLHPATPLLRGGIALIAVLAFVVSNLRERLIEMFMGGRGDYEGDPIDFILDNGYVGLALLIVAGLLIIFIAVFYLSWRMHTFRITNEVVEVRSGILYRTNRRGRLDRIQGINIVRPFFARLFGAAKLEVNVAGQDANVQLAYLSSSHADELRRDILRLASGTQVQAQVQVDAAAGATVPGGLIDKRVSELLAPELDPNLATPESVVKMNTGRLIGSILLNDATIILLLILAGAITWAAISGEPFALFALAPVLLGMGSFLFSRFTKSLRYSIAGTPDGVRVGYGLFTISNETLPPGRVHSVQVSQPLLWRPIGWWEIKVNRASKSSTQGASGQQNTTILPVGDITDVIRVLGLVLPGLVNEESDAMLRRGLTSRGGDDGFVNSPRRAAPIRWFSWRRNGFAFGPDVVLLRKGAIWRELIVVPEPRVQSVSLQQGPLLRKLGLASIVLQTVAGPISASLGAVDKTAALEFFETASREVITSSTSDTSHRWRSGEALEVGAAAAADHTRPPGEATQ
ncbi:MAG: hypothetical protein JWQ43_3502 [Glaciihabitans sp.]|nr:hypothetical protein [Glaciihabitans sp.]